MKELQELFREISDSFFNSYPNLLCKWDNASTCIEIPSKSDSGFDVVVIAEETELIVFGAGAHQHMETSGDDEMLVREALGLVYDLLTPGMRIVEYSVGRSPYKWIMQTDDGDDWVTDVITTELSWTLFRRKKRRILQNHHLPIREKMIVGRERAHY